MCTIAVDDSVAIFILPAKLSCYRDKKIIVSLVSVLVPKLSLFLDLLDTLEVNVPEVLVLH